LRTIKQSGVNCRASAVASAVTNRSNVFLNTLYVVVRQITETSQTIDCLHYKRRIQILANLLNYLFAYLDYQHFFFAGFDALY